MLLQSSVPGTGNAAHFFAHDSPLNLPTLAASDPRNLAHQFFRSREGTPMSTRKQAVDAASGGLTQYVAVALTVFLGLFVAITKSGYFTFAATIFGVFVVKGLQLIPWRRFILRGVTEPRTTRTSRWQQEIGSLFGRGFHALSVKILGAARGTALREHLDEFFRLFSSLAQIVRRELPGESNVMLFAGTFQSPVYYLRWAVVGLMMGVIFSGRSLSGDSLGAGISWELDLTIGLLIALSAMRDVMSADARQARKRAEDHLPESIKKGLLGIHTVPDMSETEAEGYLAELRRQTEQARFRIGRFFSNGVVLAENGLNIAIGTLVLFLISPLAAMLGVGALLLTVWIVASYRITQRKDEEPLYRLRSRRASLYKLAQHPDLEPLRESVSRPDTFMSALQTLDQEISDATDRAAEEARTRRNIARWVFFTLFGLSAIYPLHAAFSGELRPRLALLYIFSMIGLWLALSSAIEKAFQLREELAELGEVQEALALLEKQGGDEAATDNTRELIQGSQVEFHDLRCAPTPFAPTMLRWPPVRTVQPGIPGTATIDNEVKVIGPPRSGRSLLLKLLTGHVLPSRGEVHVGGVSLSEVGLSERRSRLLLVPECPGPFPTTKVMELFQSFCGPEIENNDVRAILGHFYLLDDFEAMGSGEFKGENLLIEWRDRHLSDQQTKLLWLALHYGALWVRSNDRDFNPKIIAVDGVHKIEGLKLREAVLDRFRLIANDRCAKFISVVRDRREIGDKDWVLALLPPEQVPPDAEEDGSKAHLVTGGLHKQLFNNPNQVKREAYRRYLKALKEEA